MVIEKTCPGSRAIREPRPEYIDCSNCGTEVEIWTDELNGVVTVRLTGACGSCPMSTMTLRMGVERVIKREVPEVKKVVAV